MRVRVSTPQLLIKSYISSPKRNPQCIIHSPDENKNNFALKRIYHKEFRHLLLLSVVINNC